MQAGIRSKELAVVVIFARFVLPVVLGGLAVVLRLLGSIVSRMGQRSSASGSSPAR